MDQWQEVPDVRERTIKESFGDRKAASASFCPNPSLVSEALGVRAKNEHSCREYRSKITENQNLEEWISNFTEKVLLGREQTILCLNSLSFSW